jgi:hypothetical protein
VSLEVEVEVEAVTWGVRYFSGEHGWDEAYTAVTPLSTTVPGRVLPFLSACGPLTGKNLGTW